MPRRVAGRPPPPGGASRRLPSTANRTRAATQPRGAGGTLDAAALDETRSVSPSVLRPLREALEGAPGRRLADIGGGTGNYALALKRDGWEPVVVDRSAAMLARAAAKGLETVAADASGCHSRTRALTRP